VPHGKAGYVVEPAPLSIGAALVDFYENKHLDVFNEGVIEQKKRFSWEAMTAEFLNLL
jgi:glycosyltransferase involved in cell wall biosynthesis